MAVMGPSGSGKTTLSNVFFGQKSIDEGTITLNGESLNSNHRRRMAYIMQQDLFKASLTLEQTLMFHGQLKLPSYMTYQQKKEYVAMWAKVLKLDDSNLLKTSMGDVQQRGLSGGEMKRANILCEMLNNASVLLVDEPTTGLDSHNALNALQILKRYAVKNSCTIIMNIHQPSTRMFQLFDSVLLLTNGEVAYFGNRCEVLGHFEQVGLRIDPYYNPADFIVDQLFTDNRERLIEETRRRCERELVSAGNGINQITLERNMHPTMPMVALNILGKQGENARMRLLNTPAPTTESGQDSGRSSMFSSTGNSSLSGSQDNNMNFNKFPNSWWEEVKILTRHNFYSGKSKLFRCFEFGPLAFLGLLFIFINIFQNRSEENLSEINGLNFYLCLFWYLKTIFNGMTIYINEANVIDKERASGMYRLSSLITSIILAELPVTIIPPLIHYAVANIIFFGYPQRCSLQCLFLVLILFFSKILGILIGMATRDHEKAGAIGCIICMPNILFGFFIPLSIAEFFSWIEYVNPLSYVYYPMKIIELQYGAPIKCAEKNSVYDACRYDNATFIPVSDLLKGEFGFPFHVLYALGMLIVVSILALYIVLRFFRSPTKKE